MGRRLSTWGDMKTMRRLLPLAAAALAGLLGAAVQVAEGRHILLEGGTPPGVTRFLSQRVELADGQTQSWVTLTAVQVDVQVGCRAKAVDQRDGAAMPFVGLELSAVQQMAREHELHQMRHRS